MGLLDKLFKILKVKKVEEKKEETTEQTTTTEGIERVESSQKDEPIVLKNYPNGLPLKVLKVIDYKKFGLILKQKNLLPPSYDKNPISVKFGDIFGVPRVVLTFKSTTSENFRFVTIYKYTVSYTKNINNQTTTLDVDNSMSEEWINFVNTIMWAWDRDFRFNLLAPISDDEPTRTIDDDNTAKELMFTDKLFVNMNIGGLFPEKRKDIAQSAMQEDMEYMESIKENKKAID